MRIFTFKNFRILILIFILAAVLIYTKNQRLVTQGWYKPLEVVVFPINADSNLSVDEYIKTLTTKVFPASTNSSNEKAKSMMM